MGGVTRRAARAPVRIRRGSFLAASLILGLLVSGCEWFVEPPPPCPRVSILNQARLLTLYQDGPGRDLSDVTFEIAILDIASRCDYDLDEGQGEVDIEFVILLQAQRGPAAEIDSVAVPFFVALADPEREIVAKQVFDAGFVFEDNAIRVQSTEEVELMIPFQQGVNPQAFETFVGFQLTRNQLEDLRRRQAR